MGYEFEDENGFVGDLNFGVTHGLRLNHAVYGQQMLSLGDYRWWRAPVLCHNETFGNKGVPGWRLRLQA